MEVDFQSLFGLHVTWCARLFSLAETPQGRNSLPPLAFGLVLRKALLVRKDRHLFVTPCFILFRWGDDRPAWRSSLAPGWRDGWNDGRSRRAPPRGESWASPPAAPAGPLQQDPPTTGCLRLLKRIESRVFTSFVVHQAGRYRKFIILAFKYFLY